MSKIKLLNVVLGCFAAIGLTVGGASAIPACNLPPQVLFYGLLVAGICKAVSGCLTQAVGDSDEAQGITPAQLDSKKPVYTPPPSPKLPLVIFGLLCLALTGCTSYITASGENKVATRITVHQFGVILGVSAANQTPSITLGTSTVMLDYIPLSTNGIIFAPDLATVVDDANNANPFTFNGIVTEASGQDATYLPNGTNTVVAQPIGGYKHYTPAGTNTPSTLEKK